MDIVRGEHGNAAMSMLGVVPREERSTEGDGGGDVVEAPREAWVILQGLELRLGERLSSDTWGRLIDRVTPRSASSCAVHLLVIGAPRRSAR